MTFSQFLTIMRARWLGSVILLVATSTVALIGSLLWPEQYTGQASLVIDLKPDPITFAMSGGAASPNYIATQVDIIQSPRVAQRVVSDLKLAEVPQLRQQWLDSTDGNGDFNLWLQSAIGRTMDVVPSRVSNVITITYKAPDPRFAAAVANAYMKAYIDTTLSLRVDPARKYSSFFDSQSKDAREALDKAQVRLSAFQKEKGIIATDERLDIESSRLSELSSQLVVVQAMAGESSSRNVAAQGGQADRLQEVLTNPVVAQLKADSGRAEARLQELSTRLGDRHPQVVEAKASLNELRSRLEAETKRITGGVAVSNSIMRQRESQIRAELEAQRTRVLRMKAVRDEGMLLVRDVEIAQRAFDAISQRFTQTSLESQTTQSNVNVLAEAQVPNQPSSPRVALNTCLGVFLGLIFAVAYALLREWRDPRVRTENDITSILRLPVIGVMIHPDRGLRITGKGPSVMQARLMAPAASAGRSE